MKRWSTGIWYRPVVMMVLISFFFLYGTNLSLLGGVLRISSANAQNLDDLLEDDDEDLLDDIDNSQPEAETEEPAPSKSAEKEDLEDEDDFEDEDDLEDEDYAEKGEARDDLEEEDDLEDEEDDMAETKAEPKSSRPDVAKPVLGPNVNGDKNITPVVFAASDKNERRAVEVDMLTRDWFKSSPKFTWKSVNNVLGEKDAIDVAKQSQKAKALLEEGIESFRNGEYEDALDTLDLAIEAYGPILDHQEYRKKVEEAKMYIGASLVKDDDEDEGMAVFVRLLQNNSKASIKDMPFSKEVLEIFDEAIDELYDAPTSSVDVTSTPSKAAVYVDGNFRGITPIKIDNLSVDSHYFKVVKPAHKGFEMQIRLFKGVEKKLPVTLSQVDKYYSYKGEVQNIKSNYRHKAMWGAVQELSDVFGSDYLYFCKVSEAGNIVTLEAYFYDIFEEIYKTDTYSIDLTKEDLETGVLVFLETFFNTNYVEEMDTYIPPEQVEEPAAVAAATPFYTTWWFWTVVGVVVAGGVCTGLYFGGVFDSGGGNSGPEFENPNSINVNF